MLRIARALPLAALLVAAACSDGTGPGDQGRVSLMLSGRGPAAGPAAAAPDTIRLGGATLVFNRVQIVLRDVRLRKVGDGCQSGEDCGTIHADATLIDLPVDGSVAEGLLADIEPGQYDRIQLQIHKPTSSADATFIAANPGFDGVSVRIEGAYNGTAFTYATDITAVQTLPLTAPLNVIAGQTTAVTLDIDLGTWFVNGSALIDPALLLSSPVLRSQVEQNIRTSLRAF